MKLNTALKLSALAVSMGLTSTVNAATVNDGTVVTDPGATWSDVATGTATKDSNDYQFVDLGSGTKPATGSTGATTTVTNKITSLHKATNGYFIQFGEGDDAKYYAADVDDTTDPTKLVVNGVDYANVKTKAEVEAAGATVNKPILGGLTQEKSVTSSTQNEIKLVDSNFLQYGTKEQTTTTTTSASGNLTDDVVGAPLQTGTVNANTPVVVNDAGSEHTITVGNIAAETGQKATTTNYGVDIVKIDGGKLVGQTTLTLEGLTTTGTVTAKDVTADKITLGGKDLAQTIVDGDAATLTAANNYTDTVATTLRDDIASGDEATLKAANTYTDKTATELRAEAATESTRVDQAISAGDVATLASANTYTNTAVSNITNTANAYTDVQIAGVNTRVNQLNKRIDDVEKTSYRGIAIALAAQQQIPNIGAGQFAVFGGAGHYEGESAAALGVASVLADGRTAFSAALGFAGGNEVGGRVGVSYVFGGK